MLLSIHPENPDVRKIKQVIECLKDGGVIIYPTDTVYAYGCDIYNQKAIEKVCQIKGIDYKKANLSFICSDLSQVSDFTLPIDNQTFRMMKEVLPGPFTFILKANNTVPKMFKNKKKTVGVRIPNNAIAQALIQGLNNPILSTSLKNDDDEIHEYFTDPIDIHDKFGHEVDIVVDGGIGGLEGSRVIDCTTDEPIVLRE